MGLVDHFLPMLDGWNFQDLQFRYRSAYPENFSLLPLVESGLPTQYIIFSQILELSTFFTSAKMYGVGRPLSTNDRSLQFSGYTVQIPIYISWKFEPPNVSRKWSTNLLHYFSQSSKFTKGKISIFAEKNVFDWSAL